MPASKDPTAADPLGRGVLGAGRDDLLLRGTEVVPVITAELDPVDALGPEELPVAAAVVDELAVLLGAVEVTGAGWALEPLLQELNSTAAVMRAAIAVRRLRIGRAGCI